MKLIYSCTKVVKRFSRWVCSEEFRNSELVYNNAKYTSVLIVIFFSM